MVCKILHISWRDKVINEKVRELTQPGKLEDVFREMDGYVMRMELARIARAVVNWTPPHVE